MPLRRSIRLAGRSAGVLLLLALIGTAITGSVKAAPSAVEEARDRADSVAEAYESAVVELMLAEGRLDDAERRLTEAQERVAGLSDGLAAAKVESERAAADLSEVEARVSSQLEETYKAGRASWLAVLFESGDFNDFLHRARMLGRVAASEADLRAQIAEKRRAADAAVEDLEEAKAREEAAVSELESSRVELVGALTEQERVTNRLGDRLTAARQDLAAARERMEEINRRTSPGQPSRDAGRDRRPGARTGGDDRPAAPSAGAPATGSGPIGPPATAAPATAVPSDSESGDPPSAATPSGGRQIEAKVTAYALRGTTATGVRVRRGIIAVDPRVIPLGTRLYVPGYGEGIAADTGSAVKGNVVDVWLPSRQEALDWGIKHLTVTVYD